MATQSDTVMKQRQIFNSLFFLALCTMLPLSLMAQPAEEKLTEASREYNHKNYEQAINIYQSIINEGLESSGLYYNLGNAYYRSGDITSAIYYYEKAHKLAPTDRDILHNIQVVTAKTLDKIDQVPEIFYLRWWKLLLDSFTEKTLSVLMIITLILVLGSGVIYILVSAPVIRSTSAWTGMILLLLFIAIWLVAAGKKHQLSSKNEAIIFTPTVEVKSSPDEASTLLFVIHEGTKVKLMDQVGEWQEVKIANGSQGWIRSQDMKVI